MKVIMSVHNFVLLKFLYVKYSKKIIIFIEKKITFLRGDLRIRYVEHLCRRERNRLKCSLSQKIITL